MIIYKPLQHIRAITFDLDDTLYDNMPYMHAAEKSLRQYIKVQYPVAAKISRQQWANIKQQTLVERPELSNDVGALRSRVLTQGFLNVGMAKKDVSAAMQDCFDYFYQKRSDFKVDKPERKLLKKLAEKVPLAAITNGNVDCKVIGIKKYFTHIVHASLDHPMKPDAGMFNYMAKKLNIPAKNILHVGDDLDKDVRGAIDAGYQSAWFAANRSMALRKETASILPHVQLSKLSDLKKLIKYNIA